MPPHPQVLSQRVGDEIVLVHLGTNRILTLNRTAAPIWELLAAGRRPEDIRPDMLKPYDVDPDRLARDVASLVDVLRRENLLDAEK